MLKDTVVLRNVVQIYYPYTKTKHSLFLILSYLDMISYINYQLYFYISFRHFIFCLI